MDLLGEDGGESVDDLLMISLVLTNKRDDKKLDFSGWSGASGSAFTAATLKDDLDNRYKRIGFGFTSEVKGQSKSQSIYPGESGTELLVFETPIGKASTLILSLPTLSVGGGDIDEKFDVAFPTSEIARE